MNLHIQETWINASEGYSTGSTDVYESYTDDKGELFRSLQNEYGRCISRVYIDSKNGQPQAVGWVFQKRQKYDDSNDTFLLETWVTVHKSQPVKTVSYNYA
jgi:hypothetical protein